METPSQETQTIEEQPSGIHGCLTAFVIFAALFVVLCLGVAWLFTVQGDLTKLFFGSLGTPDLIRALLYGLGLSILFGGIALLLRDPRVALWRGVALALAAAGGAALIAGIGLAIDRSMRFPGIPDSLRMLALLVYAAVWVILSRRTFLSSSSGWRILLGMALGGIVSAAWLASGVLGTPIEVGLSLLEALAYSLAVAVILSLIFFYDPTMLTRRPFWSAVIAGGVYLAVLPGLMAGRGWWFQGWFILFATAPLGLIAGMLLTLDPDRDPRRTWWVVFGFLLVALLLPFALTEGFEAEWMPEEVPAAWSPASLISFGVASGLAFLLLITQPLLPRISRSAALSLGTAVLSLILAASVYFGFGQPGIQPDAFFVVMNDQPNTTSAQSIEDRDERVTTVYQTLVDQAESSQADLRALLDRQHVRYTPYYLVNGIEVEGTPLLQAQIAARSDVARILESPHTRPLPRYAHLEPMLSSDSNSPPPQSPAAGVAEMNVEQVWQQGITGEGIIVGQADSGVDWHHPAVHDQYLGSEGNHDYMWFDPWYGTTEPTDQGGHGTHTLGTVLGKFGIGVAPNAKWIGCRNLARNLGDPPYYLDCMQFLFAPFPQNGDPFKDGDPTRGAHVTNNSWGCPPEEGCDAVTLSIGVQHLVDAGQMMVVSAGNDGPKCDTIWAPANAQAAFSVGAIDPHTEKIANFSSRGPILGDGSGRIKPDVVAPGEDILSSVPGGGYLPLEGTSMAGPHVAGLVALIWSANPALIGQIDQTEKIIEETAHPHSGPDLCGGGSTDHNNVYGYGAVDALKAVQAALDAQH